jgi:hypothetical protein
LNHSLRFFIAVSQMIGMYHLPETAMRHTWRYARLRAGAGSFAAGRGHVAGAAKKRGTVKIYRGIF